MSKKTAKSNNSSYETLDLHGVRHQDVELLVENFILANKLPVKIITSNSNTMKKIINSVLEKYNLKQLTPTAHNLGEIIVYE